MTAATTTRRRFGRPRWLEVGDAGTATGCALLEAQFRILQKQIPLFCGMLLLNLVSLGYSIHAMAAPLPLLGLPLLLTVAATGRMAHWLRQKERRPTPDDILRALDRTLLLAGFFSTAFAVSALLLFDYADARQQAFIIVFIALTSVGCAYCLESLPAAARLVLLFFLAPTVVRLLATGDGAMISMGLNLALLALLSLRLIAAHHGQTVRFVSSRTELIAERERARQAEAVAVAEKARVKAIADTDALTGLVNRRAFLRLLDETIAEAKIDGAGFAVALIDLDGFKPINDRFGHSAGDMILAHVGDRLIAVAGEEAVVARLGGDEFAVLLPSCESGEAALAKGESICAALRSPFDVGHTIVGLSGSCGMALHPGAGDDAARLLERADTALYHVKRNGRRCVALFSFEMEADLQRRATIEQALRLSAIETDIQLVFQPIVDLESLELRSFEALARWRHVELGQVPPEEFIRIAEEIGVIGRLTDALFEQAVYEARLWPNEMSLAFNLSALQLCSPATPSTLISIMASHDFDPRRLEIEVTETALLVDFAAARQAVNLLRSAGVRIVLDDFGAGYASIGYLREMAFDMIKLDGALIQPITRSAAAQALLKGVLDLCAAIGAPCIAEQVESGEHLALLRRLGCQYGQGYHFSPPLPAAAAAQLATKAATGDERIDWTPRPAMRA